MMAPVPTRTRRFGSSFVYVLGLLVTFAGCGSDPVNPDDDPQELPVENDLVIDFQLTDEAGRTTTRFAFGEDILFRITAVNRTDAAQPWSGLHYEEAFGFRVVAMDTDPSIDFGSTLDGSACTCEPDSGILEPGGTLAHHAAWRDYPGHVVLAPGRYRAVAGFNLRFDHLQPDIEPISFTVLPPNPDAAHVFSVFRMPAMGFCPPEGRFLWAQVIKTRLFGLDRYILVGERVVELGLGVPGCPPNRPCPVTDPITPLVLDAAEQATLEQLIAEFPNVDPEINHACDPCYITLYRIGNAIRRVGSCIYAPPEYLEHMSDLEQFVESLVSVQLAIDRR